MKVTIVYDNDAWKDGVTADWGFSCLVEAHGRVILFDTGARGSILLDNMNKLDVDPGRIDDIVISHSHWDHVGGMDDVLALKSVGVYLPTTCPEPARAKEVIRVEEPGPLFENIYSTGTLHNMEQSLVVATSERMAVIVGCAHPGVRDILATANSFGRVGALIGGLHGFSDFELVKDLELVCPTHCTKHKERIKELYPDTWVSGGVGKVIEL
jgi:7,8-dihydropterin-6-yl-methyl-4-(beta-D-ribofuranosyl)aminobenzene 5'-phosphate synthase